MTKGMIDMVRWMHGEKFPERWIENTESRAILDLSTANSGPSDSRTRNRPRKSLTFSICSVVNGPPYFSFPKSSLKGSSSSQ